MYVQVQEDYSLKYSPSNSRWIMNREFANQELKTGESMRLGEEIGNLLRRGKIRKRKSASKIVVANEVKCNLKMLRSLVKNWLLS